MTDQQDLVREVDELNERVKTLGLNLAIYLAKAKNNESGQILNRLEPDFIRLVNGVVKTVQEMTALINAARNSEIMVSEPMRGRHQEYALDVKLQAIAAQCQKILSDLALDASTRGRSENYPSP